MKSNRLPTSFQYAECSPRHSRFSAAERSGQLLIVPDTHRNGSLYTTVSLELVLLPFGLD